MKRSMIERYCSLVPVPFAKELSMGEGDTPLVKLHYASQLIGHNVYIKHEGANPTGSFKDRGMVVAIGRAKARGASGVLCASTGNTAASAAAYAARAGLKCSVILPRGLVSASKLTQAMVYGAKVIMLDAGFDRCLEIVRQLEGGQWTIVNSINPDRIDGQGTLAFEIIEDLGAVPDICILPVGNAGNITAIWRGFCRWPGTDVKPVMVGVQAEGAAPLQVGKPIANPETVASAIRIGNPASWEGALRAIEESNGTFWAVSDEDIIRWGKEIAKYDGVAAEPASMAAIAGLLKAKPAGTGKTIVVVLTGHLLKDMDPFSGQRVLEVDADVFSVKRILGG